MSDALDDIINSGDTEDTTGRATLDSEFLILDGEIVPGVVMVDNIKYGGGISNEKAQGSSGEYTRDKGIGNLSATITIRLPNVQASWQWKQFRRKVFTAKLLADRKPMRVLHPAFAEFNVTQIIIDTWERKALGSGKGVQITWSVCEYRKTPPTKAKYVPKAAKGDVNGSPTQQTTSSTPASQAPHYYAAEHTTSRG